MLDGMHVCTRRRDLISESRKNPPEKKAPRDVDHECADRKCRRTENVQTRGAHTPTGQPTQRGSDRHEEDLRERVHSGGSLESVVEMPQPRPRANAAAGAVARPCQPRCGLVGVISPGRSGAVLGEPHRHCYPDYPSPKCQCATSRGAECSMKGSNAPTRAVTPEEKCTTSGARSKSSAQGRPSPRALTRAAAVWTTHAGCSTVMRNSCPRRPGTTAA